MLSHIWGRGYWGQLWTWETSTSWSEARPESDLAQVPSAHPETFLRSGKAVVVGLLLHFLFCFVLFLFFFVIHLILIYFYAFIFKYIYFIFSNFHSMFSFFHTSYVFIYCFSPLVLIFFLTIFYLDLSLPLWCFVFSPSVFILLLLLLFFLLIVLMWLFYVFFAFILVCFLHLI